MGKVVPNEIINQIRHMLGHRMNVLIIGGKNTGKTDVINEVALMMNNVKHITPDMEELSVEKFIFAAKADENCQFIVIDNYESAIREVESINKNVPLLASVKVDNRLDQQETLDYLTFIVGNSVLMNTVIFNIEKKQIFRHNFHDEEHECECNNSEEHKCCCGKH